MTDPYTGHSQCDVGSPTLPVGELTLHVPPFTHMHSEQLVPAYGGRQSHHHWVATEMHRP